MLYILRTYRVLKHKFRFFYHIPIWLFSMIIIPIHFLILLGTLLARENIEGTVWFFKFGMQM